MAQVIWTENATNEILEIAEYLEQYSHYYASIIIKKIYQRASQLENFTKMGRIIPELKEPNYRELIEGNYRIMYEILLDDIILIQRVIHQSRDFKDLFDTE